MEHKWKTLNALNLHLIPFLVVFGGWWWNFEPATLSNTSGIHGRKKVASATRQSRSPCLGLSTISNKWLFETADPSQYHIPHEHHGNQNKTWKNSCPQNPTGSAEASCESRLCTWSFLLESSQQVLRGSTCMNQRCNAWSQTTGGKWEHMKTHVNSNHGF